MGKGSGELAPPVPSPLGGSRGTAHPNSITPQNSLMVQFASVRHPGVPLSHPGPITLRSPRPPRVLLRGQVVP